jgi:ubiquinone/menaquinone biosynthesis C-methylase UbiE
MTGMTQRIDTEATGGYAHDRVAAVYEWMARLYSLGRIQALKAEQAADFPPGGRVLFAGVGAGEDLLAALRAGSRITAIDLSRAMLERTRRCCVRHPPGTVELIRGDIMAHHRFGYYDAVTANFFLNVFPPPVMRGVLAHLAALTRAGGKLLIADFALPCGNFWQRRLQQAYFAGADLVFWLLRQCALHPIYDYAAHFAELGLTLAKVKHFRLPGGVGGYQSLVAIRDGNEARPWEHEPGPAETSLAADAASSLPSNRRNPTAE